MVPLLPLGGGDGTVLLRPGQPQAVGLAQLQHRQEGGHHLGAAAVALEQGAEPGDPGPEQPADDLPCLFRHRV